MSTGPSPPTAPAEALGRYQSFAEFWPFYLSEHRVPLNRALHFAGTTAGLITAGLAVATLNPLLVPLAVAFGYAGSWAGHFFVERNRPAAFRYPLWSFLGDFKMYGLIATGRIGAELAAHGLA